MDKQDNFALVAEAIWDNPEKLFNCQFKGSPGNDRRDNLPGGEYDKASRITLERLGSSVVLHYNGSDRLPPNGKQSWNVFAYAGTYITHTGWEDPAAKFATLVAVAEIYGVRLVLTGGQQEAVDRARLVRACADALQEYTRTHQDGKGAQYLRGRGLQTNDGRFVEVSMDSLAAMKASLEAHNIRYTQEALAALGLTASNARQGFNCGIPYKVAGNVRGFFLRNVDKPGKLYSTGMELGGGYSESLKADAPAVLVEGVIDALTLIQAGVSNVVAMGSSSNTKTPELLHRYGISEVISIPDLETYPNGKRKRTLVERALKMLVAAQVDGEPTFKRVRIADLPTPEEWRGYEEYKDGKLKGYKTDVNRYLKDTDFIAVANLPATAVEAWQWRAEALLEEQATPGQLEDGIEAIYKELPTATARERFCKYLTETADNWSKAGITPDVLQEWASSSRRRDFREAVKKEYAKLGAALDKGASARDLAGIIKNLNAVQGTESREAWQAQIDRPFDDMLAAVRNQPEAMQTEWELGTKNKDGQYFPYGKIAFFPADIAIVCGATSHGKTSFMFQAALNLMTAAENKDKVFLYISSEENERQLLERILKPYLAQYIPTTKDGIDAQGKECFKENWRATQLKKALTASTDDIPEPGSLQERILLALHSYKRDIAPRLHLIHTEATAESITANISYFVEQFRRQGKQVGAVFYDYIQLLTSDVPSYSRHDELKYICKALKDCAAGVECPFVIGAQLNRDALKTDNRKAGVDNVTLANLGEAADIERIAHDVYFVWQCERTPLQAFTNAKGEVLAGELGERSRRLFIKDEVDHVGELMLAKDCMYLEQMKARDGRSGGWGLFKWNGEAGTIDTENQAKNVKQ